MRKMFLFLVLTLITLMLVNIVNADSDSLTIQTTGTNYDPVVDTCGVDASSYNPTEGSITVVTVKMNVTDTNGIGDLNNSLAKVEFDDNTASFVALYESATNTSCSSADIDADTREYTCTVNMQYWYQHPENFSVRCFAGDNNDTTLVTTDAANAFDYTQLVASSADGTTVDFGTITSGDYGTTVTDTNSPLNITNTGNTVLSTVSVTGADLTQTGKPNIDVGQFAVDELSTYSGAAQNLTTGKQQVASVSVSLEDSTPGGNYDEVYVWFTVPGTLEPGSYSGTWTLWEEE